MADGPPLLMVAAGGTGGHMFPAAAFAAEMRKRGWRIGLVSDDRGLTYADTFPADWSLAVQAASPNLRKPWTLPATLAKLNTGIGSARARIREEAPCLVAGFGGYPAFPALAAARRAATPILIHEQNAVLGRVNRRFAVHAGVIASGFARLDRLPARAKARHVGVGNPVRAPVAAMRDAAYRDPDGPLNILITGGSQGARILGEVLPLAIANHVPEELRARLTVVQQVREAQVGEVARIYARAGIDAQIETFFSDMPERLAAAHLVIARSGAGTVSEIAAVGRPSILIPLKIAMDDHQTANAEALTQVSAADLVLEDNLYPKLLGELIGARLGDGQGLRERAAAARAAGSVTAASDLADLAEQVAERGAATS